MKVKVEDLVNLTPHDVVLVGEGDKKVVIKKSGFILRVKETLEVKEKLVISNEDNEEVIIKLGKKELSDFNDEDLEKLKEILSDKNKFVIVSLLVAKKLKDLVTEKKLNIDLNRVLFIVNTIRDSNGVIIGADTLGEASDL